MALGLTGANPIIFNVCEVRSKKEAHQIDPDAKMGPKLFAQYNKPSPIGRDMVSASGQWLIISGANGRYINYPPSLGPTKGLVDSLLHDVRVAWMELLPYPSLGNAKSPTPGAITAIAVKNNAEMEQELDKPALANLCSVNGSGGTDGPPVYTRIWTVTDVLVAFGFASIAIATGAYYAIPQFKEFIDGIKSKASGQDLSKFITSDVVKTAEGFYNQYVKEGGNASGGGTDQTPKPIATADANLTVVFRGGGEIKVAAKKMSDGSYDFHIGNVPVVGQLDINYNPSDCSIKPSGGLAWLGGVFRVGAAEVDQTKGICWFKLPFVNFEFGVKYEKAPAQTISRYLPYIVVGGALLLVGFFLIGHRR